MDNLLKAVVRDAVPKDQIWLVAADGVHRIYNIGIDMAAPEPLKIGDWPERKR